MKISVVILTKNSQKHIGKCLKSVLNQNYHDFEVIILDAESTDDTLKIIFNEMNISKRSNLVKNISVKTDTSIGKARQIGVENSQGEVIAFIDSDVELSHNDWLKNMSVPFKQAVFLSGIGISGDIEMVAGTQTLAKAKDTDPWILKHLHAGFEYKSRIIDIKNYQMVGTGHTLIRKKLIDEIGGFRDINSFEDIDVTKKIMEKGYKFIYLPEEKVYHYHVDGLWSYIKKHWILNKRKAIRRILFE